MYPWLPDHVKESAWARAHGPSDLERDHHISSPTSATCRFRKTTHAKIVFYSRGLPRRRNANRYPFNVEMNINHEYWHLRENDPRGGRRLLRRRYWPVAHRHQVQLRQLSRRRERGEARAAFRLRAGDQRFGNLSWMDHLAGSRFPALAGWQKSFGEIFAVLNDVTRADFLAVPDQRRSRRGRSRVLVRAGRQGFRLGHGPPCRGHAAHAVPLEPRRPIRIQLGRG